MLRSGNSGSYGKGNFNFIRNVFIRKVFPKVAITFCTFTSNVWEFQFLHIFTSTWYWQCSFFFIPSLSNRCVVVPQCGFNWYFSNDWWYWGSFHTPFFILTSFLVKCCSNLLLIFNWVVFILLAHPLLNSLIYHWQWFNSWMTLLLLFLHLTSHHNHLENLLNTVLRLYLRVTESESSEAESQKWEKTNKKKPSLCWNTNVWQDIITVLTEQLKSLLKNNVNIKFWWGCEEPFLEFERYKWINVQILLILCISELNDDLFYPILRMT